MKKMHSSRRSNVIACDNCCRRKTRCEGSQPCPTCVRLAVPCTFERIIKKRGPKPGQIGKRSAGDADSDDDGAAHLPDPHNRHQQKGDEGRIKELPQIHQREESEPPLYIQQPLQQQHQHQHQHQQQHQHQHQHQQPHQSFSEPKAITSSFSTNSYEFGNDQTSQTIRSMPLASVEFRQVPEVLRTGNLNHQSDFSQGTYLPPMQQPFPYTSQGQASYLPPPLTQPSSHPPYTSPAVYSTHQRSSHAPSNSFGSMSREMAPELDRSSQPTLHSSSHHNSLQGRTQNYVSAYQPVAASKTIRLPYCMTEHLINAFQVPQELTHPDFPSFNPSLLSALVQTHYDYHYPLMPIIHFGYLIRNFSSISPFVLTAIFANAARFVKHKDLASRISDFETGKPPFRHENEREWKAGDLFYEQFSKLLPAALENPCLWTVIGLTIAIMYTGHTFRVTDQRLLRGHVSNMIRNLNMHREPRSEDLKLGNLEREMRRRVWWILYDVDVFASIAGEQLSFFDVSQCALVLPCEESVFLELDERNSIFVPTTHQLYLMNFFSSDLLYSPSLNLKSASEFYIVFKKILRGVTKWNERFQANEIGKFDLMLLGMHSLPFETDRILDEEYEILGRALCEFQASFPQYFNYLPQNFSPHINSSNPPPYMVAQILLLFYGAAISLRHSRLSPYRPIADFEAYDHCIQNATAISTISEIITRMNPSLHYVYTIITQPMFIAIMTLYPHLITTPHFSERTNTLRKLNILIEAINGGRSHSAVVSMFFMVICQFISGDLFHLGKSVLNLKNVPEVESRWKHGHRRFQDSGSRFPEDLIMELGQFPVMSPSSMSASQFMFEASSGTFWGIKALFKLREPMSDPVARN